MKECQRSFTDQLGREIVISYPPKRIVSLVPSQTELLFDLGLEKEVVGITKFCVHPKSGFAFASKVGGTKMLHLDKIKELKPDLIIANKEENERSQIDELAKEFPVWTSDITTLKEALDMIRALGRLTGKADRAEAILAEIEPGFAKINKPAVNQSLRVGYFIWKDPYMVAGLQTFINEVLEVAGWKNAFGKARYPVLTNDDIRRAQPDIIFLSSEPYPFKEKHLAEFRAICPKATILLVDGELFSWYGSRLRYTPEYLRSLQLLVNQDRANNY